MTIYKSRSVGPSFLINGQPYESIGDIKIVTKSIDKATEAIKGFDVGLEFALEQSSSLAKWLKELAEAFEPVYQFWLTTAPNATRWDRFRMRFYNAIILSLPDSESVEWLSIWSRWKLEKLLKRFRPKIVNMGTFNPS